MNRREFLRGAATLVAVAAVPVATSGRFVSVGITCSNDVVNITLSGAAGGEVANRNPVRRADQV